MKKRIVVALSGGMDSSFSAYLMLKKGYEVVGLHMDLGLGEVEEGRCCGWQAVRSARKVASFLGIPFYVINLREKFFQKVISYFARSYLSGKTPNPCVMCNRYIKFGELLRKTLEISGEKLVTGHYARMEKLDGGWVIKKGKDTAKDQTYFLFPLLEKPLDRIEFPLGDWSKEEVRREVLRLGIPAERRESQEVCFLDRGGLASFFYERMGLSPKPGPVVTREGKVVGEHPGIFFFTLGQRRGLSLRMGEPYYVVEIIPEENKIVVGRREELYSRKVVIGDMLWREGFTPRPGERVEIKVRYQGDRVPAIIERIDGDRVSFRLLKPLWAVTPGQAGVAYQGEILIGGGWIEDKE